MKSLIPWDNINPGPSKYIPPDKVNLSPEEREIWVNVVRPLMNFYFWLSIGVLIVISGIFSYGYFF